MLNTTNPYEILTCQDPRDVYQPFEEIIFNLDFCKNSYVDLNTMKFSFLWTCQDGKYIYNSQIIKEVMIEDNVTKKRFIIHDYNDAIMLMNEVFIDSRKYENRYTTSATDQGLQRRVVENLKIVNKKFKDPVIKKKNILVRITLNDSYKCFRNIDDDQALTNKYILTKPLLVLKTMNTAIETDKIPTFNIHKDGLKHDVTNIVKVKFNHPTDFTYFYCKNNNNFVQPTQKYYVPYRFNYARHQENLLTKCPRDIEVKYNEKHKLLLLKNLAVTYEGITSVDMDNLPSIYYEQYKEIINNYFDTNLTETMQKGTSVISDCVLVKWFEHYIGFPIVHYQQIEELFVTVKLKNDECIFETVTVETVPYTGRNIQGTPGDYLYCFYHYDAII